MCFPDRNRNREAELGHRQRRQRKRPPPRLQDPAMRAAPAPTRRGHRGRGGGQDRRSRVAGPMLEALCPPAEEKVRKERREGGRR
jgi:hypothetical protein